MNIKPLSGIRVLELTTYVAAPICGRMLADLGAEVIKVETRRGDAWRSMGGGVRMTATEEENPLFDVFNAHKRSIVLDLKTEPGMAIFERLLGEADIFLTNTRMKSLRGLGIDPDTALARHPRLIYATLTGYGEKGPDRDSPGFDNVAFWTKTGFLADMMVKTEDSYPVESPTGVGDSVSGITLFSGILAALIQRERTGRGDYVTVSLYNTGIWVMSSMILRAQDRYGDPFPKTRYECGPVNAPYLCGDGQWIRIVILEYERYAPALFEAIGRPEVLRDPRFTSPAAFRTHNAELIKILEAAFLEKSADEWLRLLRERDIVCDYMRHFRDVAHCEQAWANDYVEDYVFPNGESCVMPCPPVRLRSQDVPRSTRGPHVGEHTRDILGELGLDEHEIAALEAGAAVMSKQMAD